MKAPVITTVALSLTLALTSTFATPADDEFEKIAKEYIEGYLASHPEAARSAPAV